jgi:nucleoside-diphosphate-sugar epimerase
MGGGQMKTVLVTGTGGFIGQYVTAELKNRGYTVLLFKEDIFKTDLDAYINRLHPDYLIHLAWVTGEGYLDSPKNLQFMQKSIELYQAFYQNGGERAVFVGTEQEYARTGEIFTEASPIAPASLYAECKADLGKILVKASKLYSYGFVWGRIFFVYGAGEKPKRLMPSIITGLADGQEVTCSHDGLVRDYLYVKDLAGAICHCLFSNYTGTVNLAGGRDTTIGEIAEIIRSKVGKGSVTFRSLEACKDQPPYLRGDLSLLNSLGWTHRYSLEDGLAEEIAALTGASQ